MVEYIAKRDEAHNPTRVHAFISAFHRVCDEEQRAELKIHNMKVFSITNKDVAGQCIDWINQQIVEGKLVVVHIDECDFGTGDRQILCMVYAAIRYNSQVAKLLYSATHQEVLFSGEVADKDEEAHQTMIDDMFQTGRVIEYKPPPSFCGPERFLAAGLVVNAVPFFEMSGPSTITLSIQGKESMRDIRANIASRNDRNILVLRLSYGNQKAKAIHQFLKFCNTIPELNDCLIYVDKGEKDVPSACRTVLKERIQWSNKLYWRAKRTDVPIIMVIDQTSSRSTEWKCHDRVSALHDYRDTVVFSTVSQAQERVNHYETAYNGFQPIKVYGHLNTFRLSAEQISYESYINQEWIAKKVDKRVAERAGLVGPHYKIQHCQTGARHPAYQNPVTEKESVDILRRLGCYGEVKVSPRVSGGVRLMKVFNSEFHACSKDTFHLVARQFEERFGHRFNNPFVDSEREGLDDGKYKGYLREYKVFDYEADIKSQPGWGVTPTQPRLTICYKDGVLGVALRYDTGHRDEKNTFHTFRSMYVR